MSPSGARGHRITLKAEATKDAAQSIKGMGVNCTLDLKGHDAKKKIGIITSVRVRGKSIWVKGHLWAKDFPGEIEQLKAAGNALGMSFEAADAFVRDMRAEVWEIEPRNFTGAAIILKDKSSYKTTSFKIIH